MYARISVLALILTVLASSTSHAFMLYIQEGHEYSFNGYLVTRMGNNYDVHPGILPPPALRVVLTPYPNGEVPQHIIPARRQNIYLTQGTLTTNLFTLARQYGPTVEVHVTGKGTAFHELAVTALSPVAHPLTAAALANPLPVATPVDQAKADALARFAKLHPETSHVHPDGYGVAVKSATVDPRTGAITVVCDLFGGFAGTWGRHPVAFVYDAAGHFVSQSPANP